MQERSDLEPGGILLSLQATGFTLAQAWAHLWKCGDVVLSQYALGEAVRALRAAGAEKDEIDPASILLEEIFVEDEVFGRAVLDASRNLTVNSYFQLAGLKIERLPAGMRVFSALDLSGCKTLAVLPVGLEVRDDLYLQGCTSWDGVIPEDAKIGGRIFCDVLDMANGVNLGKWRELEAFFQRKRAGS